MADSTADSTAIIIIDATSWDYIASDTTGVSAVQAATANTLINDFSDSSEPLLTQATAIFEELEDIKNLISGYSPSDYTPDALLDTLTQQSLDASFKSSAWLTASDNIQQIQAVKQECNVLGELSKYADTGSFIDSMKGGVLKDAMDAIGGVADQFKLDFPSLSLPEFEIGKRLSDLVNTGRSLYDDVATSFSEAVSDVIEHGKGGLAKATAAINKQGGAVDGAIEAIEGGLTSMAEPMRILDGMINCVDSVGGGPFAGKTDQMIDRANDIYDKTGVVSDPNSPNFGEFDEATFFNSIGGLTPDQQSKLKKGLNTYNKASNNAVGVVEKAKATAETSKEWEKSTSSLFGGGNKESTERKSNYVTDNVKVEVDVPAIPGGSPASTITPTPKPVAPPTPPPLPAATSGTSYRDLIVSYEVVVQDGSNYLDYDPEMLGFPDYKSLAIRAIPPGKTQNPKELKVYVVLGKVIHQVGTIENIFTEDDKSHHFSITPIYVRIYRNDGSTPKNLLTRSVGLWSSDYVPESKFREFDPDLLTQGTIRAGRTYIENAIELDNLPTAENMETLLAL
jgi:hypothetical protein